MDFNELNLPQTGWAVSGKACLEHNGTRYSVMMDNTEVDGPLTRTSMLKACQVPDKYQGQIVSADLDIYRVFGGFITRWERCLAIPESYRPWFPSR